MTLNQMQYFSMACETQNLSLAAQLLYVSQPTLSASLSALEKEVGFQLFHRKSKGIYPTEEAFILLHHVNDILEKVNQMQQELPLISKHQHVIRVGFRPYVGEETFFRICPDFKNDYSQLDFSVHEITTQRTYIYLEEDQIDVLFANSKAIPAGLQSKYESCKVGTERMAFFVNANSPLAAQSEVTLSDFENHPIAFWEGHQLMVNQLQRKVFEQNMTLNIISVMPQVSSLLQYVKNGLANAFLPEIFALDIPDVCSVPISQEVMSIIADGVSQYDVYAYWNKNVEKYEGKRQFIRFLKSQMKANLE